MTRALQFFEPNFLGIYPKKPYIIKYERSLLMMSLDQEVCFKSARILAVSTNDPTDCWA